jgi:hypothetical protein
MKPAYFFLAAVLWASSAFTAEDRPIQHFTIKIKDIDTLAVDYYVRLPKGYDASKSWPMIYCVPGSGMDQGTVEANQARNYVDRFSEGPFEQFIAYSIWFTEASDTYPHWTNERAVQAADKVLNYMLTNYSVDHSKIFMEFFSAGGVLSSKYPFTAYSAKSPVVLAGVLWTSANFRGSNANAACVNIETKIFIEVGDHETPEYGLPCDLIREAHGYESVYKDKMAYLEFNLIPGQDHNISDAAQEKINAFIVKSLADIDAAAKKSEPAKAEKIEMGAKKPAASMPPPDPVRAASLRTELIGNLVAALKSDLKIQYPLFGKMQELPVSSADKDGFCLSLDDEIVEVKWKDVSDKDFISIFSQIFVTPAPDLTKRIAQYLAASANRDAFGKFCETASKLSEAHKAALDSIMVPAAPEPAGGAKP